MNIYDLVEISNDNVLAICMLHICCQRLFSHKDTVGDFLFE